MLTCYVYINNVTKNIIISTEVCHADNDDEYYNYNALLRLLITNNIISDLHRFNF